MAPLYLLAAFILIAVNAVTVMYFWLDKRRALAGEFRVPESNLLGLALMGGTPGAFMARWLFRHKTRKQPFSIQLWLIAALQAGTAVGLFVL